MRGRIILYHTPKSGHVSKMHLMITPYDLQLRSPHRLWNVKSHLLEKVKWIFFSSGSISFTLPNILMPISFIISEQAHSLLGHAFHWPTWGGPYQIVDAFPRFPLSVWIDEAFFISMWSFLAQSRHSGLAWHGGELQFFETPFREVLLGHSFSYSLATFKFVDLGLPLSNCQMRPTRRLRNPLVFVKLILVSTGGFDSSLN